MVLFIFSVKDYSLRPTLEQVFKEVKAQEAPKCLPPDALPWALNTPKLLMRPGLRPGPRWGSLQRSPRPPSWIKGPYF